MKIKSIIFAIALFVSVNAIEGAAQTECSGDAVFGRQKCVGDEVNKDERELHQIINQYRAQNNLPQVPLSNSLSLVANRHLLDLEKNVKSMTHSWSNCAYDIKRQETWDCVFTAPQRLGTDYAGKGYENLYRNINQNATPPLALEAWKKSPLHNSLILNLSFFKDDVYDACGIAIRGNYAALWFGTVKGAKNNQFKPNKNTNLDLSFERVTEGLDDILKISQTSTTIASNKWVGISPDKTITLEIFGKRENISEATLNFRVKLVKNRLSEKNKSVMLLFLKNVMPEWSEREEWFEAALQTLYKSAKTPQTFTKDKRTAELKIDRGNFISLTVKPKI